MEIKQSPEGCHIGFDVIFHSAPMLLRAVSGR